MFPSKNGENGKFGLLRNGALIGHHAKVIKNGSYEITTLLLVTF